MTNGYHIKHPARTVYWQFIRHNNFPSSKGYIPNSWIHSWYLYFQTRVSL